MCCVALNGHRRTVPGAWVKQVCVSCSWLPSWVRMKWVWIVPDHTKKVSKGTGGSGHWLLWVTQVALNHRVPAILWPKVRHALCGSGLTQQQVLGLRVEWVPVGFGSG